MGKVKQGEPHPPTDGTPIWEHWPGEPMLWFKRFEHYRLMTDRSLTGAYRTWQERRHELSGRSGPIYKSAPCHWVRAAHKWSWKERAEAWDVSVLEQEQREWEERRGVLKKQEWNSAMALFKIFGQMALVPLVKQEVAADGSVVSTPVGWRTRDMAVIAEAASTLARLACSEPTSITNLREETLHVVTRVVRRGDNS